MEIERFNAGSCRPALQSPAVLVMQLLIQVIKFMRDTKVRQR
jgi:hypothetical protein